MSEASADSRLRATRVLASLLRQNGSLATLLRGDDTPLTRELCYGSCRWYPRLAATLGQLLKKPLKTKDGDIQALLLLGLYQLEYMRTPEHAAVHETVSCVTRLGKPWARGLVNGVLRNYQRNRDTLQRTLDDSPVSRWSHPAWLIQAIQEAWPSQWRDILEADNLHPPMTVRINIARVTREDWLEQLSAAGGGGRAGERTDTAVYLDKPLATEHLPGFREGLCSVQDEASQRVASLLELSPGLRVLDACAAPGGKTASILEQQPDLDLLALDVEERRLERVRETLQRCRLLARTACADVLDRDAWWDGIPYDRILLDAPCTATGILRRQPDIRLLRKPEDVARMTALQARMLDSLWSCLRPGGILLYTTCSVLPDENREQVRAFLERTPDARPLLSGEQGPGLQQLPDPDGPDGFFYAPLRRL